MRGRMSRFILLIWTIAFSEVLNTVRYSKMLFEKCFFRMYILTITLYSLIFLYSFSVVRVNDFLSMAIAGKGISTINYDRKTFVGIPTGAC